MNDTGYRKLAIGEVVEKGDEGLNFLMGTWHTYGPSMIGKCVQVAGVCRRPVTPVSAITPDRVNHPPHYQSAKGIGSIDAIEAALTPEEFRGFLKGNIQKYLWRSNRKGGDEDLKKAAWYLNRLTETPKP